MVGETFTEIKNEILKIFERYEIMPLLQLTWDQSLTFFVSFVSSVTLIITLVVLILQFREMKHTTMGHVYLSMMDILQTPGSREDRRYLINLNPKEFPKEGTEEYLKIEQVCARYDTIAILLRRNVIDPRLIINEWKVSITKCWEHAKPMIDNYRITRSRETWDDFEWMYNKANKVLKK